MLDLFCPPPRHKSRLQRKLKNGGCLRGAPQITVRSITWSAFFRQRKHKFFENRFGQIGDVLGMIDLLPTIRTVSSLKDKVREGLQPFRVKTHLGSSGPLLGNNSTT